MYILEKIDLVIVVNIAKEAGDAIMAMYDKDLTIDYKDDKLPLTVAYHKVNLLNPWFIVKGVI